MRWGKVAVMAMVVVACSKSTSSSPSGSLLSKLSGPATAVAGMNRGGTAESLKNALDPLLKTFPSAQSIPPCGIDVFTRIESAVVAVDASVKPPTVSFAVRGAGLRPALEGCVRTIDATIPIAADGKVARYGSGTDGLSLLWLDDNTAIGGTVANTATLADVTAPLDRDERLKPLLGRADTGAAFWFAAEVKPLLDGQSLPAPVPDTIWGKLDTQDFVATGSFDSDAGATQAAAFVKSILDRNGAELGPMVSELRIEARGKETVVTMPYGKLVAQQLGGTTKVPPEMAPAFAIGVASAVAIPAFLKNARKAKSTEAMINVKRLYNGAFVVYNENHKIPASTPITPPLGACCHHADQKCPADPELWEAPGWKALRFDLEDPHYYSYEFKNDGSSFSARAFGDVNCDGVYSTFELRGTVGADGTISSSALFKDKELE